MINCLRSDFYRAFKSKSFLILMLVLLGSAVFVIFLFALLSSLVTDELGISGKYFLEMGLGDSTIAVVSAIFASVFIGGDYSSGMMRHYAASNVPRLKVFFSKVIVCLTISVIFFLSYSFILGVSGTVIFGYGAVFNGSEFGEIIVKILIEIFLLAAYMSIFTLISVLLKGTGVSTALNVLISLLVTTFLSFIVIFFPSVSSIQNYWLAQNVTEIAFVSLQGMGKIILRVMLVGLFYLAAAIIPAAGIYKYQDIR